MEQRRPPNAAAAVAFYEVIRSIVESATGNEASVIVESWSPEVYKDSRSEMEVLLLMHGQGVSDRYVYGFLNAIVAMKQENGGRLPEVNIDEYEATKNKQDRLRAKQDDEAAAYFLRLEDDLYGRFPLTTWLLAQMENDLRTRLGVPEIDIDEGFVYGWYHAAKVVTPLFNEELRA